MQTIEKVLPLNDKIVFDLQKGAVVSCVFVDNDVAKIKFIIEEGDDTDKRKFITVSQYDVIEADNYVYLGTVKTTAGEFEAFEIVEA